MSARINFHPNRLTMTPARLPVHFEDQLEVNRWIENLERNANLRIIGNPFIMSRASQRRLKDRVMAMYRLSTPRTEKSATNKLIYNFRCSFLTLTLPAKQFHSDKEIKELALNQFLIELRQRYNVSNYVWKAELQANENIHFHIITDRFLNYHAILRRWNRILEKLGYIKKFQEKMTKLTFKKYVESYKKYKKAPKIGVLMQRYKNGVANGWSTPNTIDIRVLKNDKDVAVYMAKYVSKNVVDGSKDELSSAEKLLLERGKEFGRSWFCSRSLSRLETGFSFSISEVKVIFDEICKAKGTKEFVGDYFKVWYFRYEELSIWTKGFLRGWLLYNADLCSYVVPAGPDV